MKKRFLLLLLIFPLALSTQAQTNYGGAGYFYSGYTGLAIENLNFHLRQSSYPQATPNGPVNGGSGFVILRNLLIGGEGSGFSSTSVSPEFHLNQQFSSGYLNIGYLAFSGKKTILYPMLGLGSSSFSIKVSERAAGADFGQFLANAPKGFELKAMSPSLKLSLNMAQIILGRANHKEGLLLGISAGGFFWPDKAHWAYLGSGLSNSPETHLNGWFISLNFGGGGLGNRSVASPKI